MTAGFGLITLGDDYVRAADHLFESHIQFRHQGPVEYMFAHGFELLVKGGLLLSGRSQDEIRDYQHNLLQLYGAARSQDPVETCIKGAERHVKHKWKTLLRRLRDDRRAVFQESGISDPNALQHFGVHSNETIGKELPGFRAQIVWLDKRHRHAGGLFRYYESHVGDREEIEASGSNYDVVLQSMSWGCRFLSQKLIVQTRRQTVT
ncbi:MAG: hypothetical protein AAF214_12660 [Pseudomonadota bacterium]